MMYRFILQHKYKQLLLPYFSGCYLFIINKDTGCWGDFVKFWIFEKLTSFTNERVLIERVH